MTNRAVPKNIFQGEKGPTNEISSALLMTDPADLDLPKDAYELNLIRGNRFARSFSVYSEDNEGNLETPSGKMTRSILKWNGRFYQ
jgi:hypothetical protein